MRKYSIKEEKLCGLTSINTVFNSLPDREVMFAVIILSFKDSKTSHSLTIVSVLLLHVMLTTTVFSPMCVTFSCKYLDKRKSYKSFNWKDRDMNQTEGIRGLVLQELR